MANGYTKRANSINPIYPSKIKIEEKIEFCKKLYARYNLPVIYKLIECEEHKTIDKKLETLNYEQGDITSVQICDTIKTIDNNIKGIVIDNDFNNNWIKGFVECNKIKSKDEETIKIMLKNITGNKIAIYKVFDGEIVGCGYGVIENDFVGLFDIVVKDNNRGKGYGKEIVQSILSEAGKTGIKKSYLQMVDDNSIAKNLYKKLGYQEKYRYWYRKQNIYKNKRPTAPNGSVYASPPPFAGFFSATFLSAANLRSAL
ncbi:GNAT family N-acetyltransferase [Pillotina sp. SPG140]|jgi:GNAT superfamily N-acetyltransferase